ncbi:CYFA0S02e10264g1_1 [Cyberlindnera fabianii]|uniref:Vacuolar protein sorting-associated protein 27 n=1 Tax=Cyberlindnera fabianii TaxID=36022 RepID=A0A061AN46_CYBFA|nr:CYFA0S02e10264g1_1 [Cyberlindnera fabianii]
MSWFSSAVSIDAQVERATDESIPFGETDLATSLEVTDLIRSKQVPAKDAMRSLKKRLTSTKNPNTQLATLHLIDTCVKNGGSHFIVEVASREFIDSLVALIHNDRTNENVRDLALDLIQSWALAFKDSFQLKYINTTYNHLKDDGYSFPDAGTAISSTLFDSSAPPEWEDSDACMICSTAFSMLNRKHHCRNCGGVFCQAHSSKSIPLPELGITEPVRVCDTCYDEVHHKKKGNDGHKKSRRSKHQKDVSRARARYDSDDDEDLKKALELSLQESQAMQQPPPIPKPQPVIQSNTNEDEEDEEMKAAIAASLAEFEQEKQRHQSPVQQQQQPVQSEGPYANLLPQASTYTPSYGQALPPQPQNNFQPQAQQTLPPQLNNYMTSQEENDIVQFASKVQSLKGQPGYAIENQELTDMYRKAIPLTPKLSSDMNQSFSKYDQLIDMNTKIDQIMRLYNNLLDRRIEKESQQRQQYMATPNYSMSQSAYGYPQAQQFQHVQSPHVAQTSPQLHQPPQQQLQPTYNHQSPHAMYQQPHQVYQQQQQQSSPYPTQPYPVSSQMTGQSVASSTSAVPSQSVPQLPELQQSSYEPPSDPFKDPSVLNDDEQEEEEEEFTAPPPSQEPSQPLQTTEDVAPAHSQVQSPVSQHTSPLAQQVTSSYSPQQQQQQQQQSFQYSNGYAPQQTSGQSQGKPQSTPYPPQSKITDITFPTVPMNKPPVMETIVPSDEVVQKEEAQLIDL